MFKRKPTSVPLVGLTDDPRWYRDAVIYELRVRSFNDSNGDGMGDLPGLTEKLDYLQDLGVTALWLLPICPSPGRDDGYDISDYTDVQQDIGTLDDFKVLVEQAHRRGLRIITELVLNHTSDQHPWFHRARRSPPGSVERDFYVWSDTPERLREARIIFKDFETSNWAWDPIAKAYYWHRFYSHQPDLNFRNPTVRQAMLEVVDFWFALGVDGLRLDAVPYLFEEEGTNCENLPDTHGFLRELRKHVDTKFRNRMLLAEANQWPEDAAAYFGRGDECHMNFHFPIMPRLFMSIDMEDRFPILDILAQTPEPPEGSQWALFLRNHDELTLEMVTDEERDYMYRAYAHDPTMRINLGIRRRLAPLVGNNRRKIELMNGLLASLPGTPVLYYGDEIGMGDNVYLGDRNGVRTPMQWSADRNAGFSRANPQKLILPVNIDPEYHYESVNVEALQNNTSSLLWWTKRLLSLRRRFQAFGRGTLEMLAPENHRVLAFLRQYEGQTILVVANLSRFIQFVELDLSRLKGSIPVELFGRTEFPAIGELPYLLTLGGYAFYWFALETRGSSLDSARESAYNAPVIDISSDPRELLSHPEQSRVETVLSQFLTGRSWYESRDRDLTRVAIDDQLQLEGPVALLVVRAEYSEGPDESYILPVAVESGTIAREIATRAPNAVIARLRVGGEAEPSAVITDAIADGRHANVLLEALAQNALRRGSDGILTAACVTPIATVGADGSRLETRALRAERGRAALSFGDRYMLKLVRKLGEGISPDLEIGRSIAQRKVDSPIPAFLGAMEFRRGRAEPVTLATLSTFIPHEANAHQHIGQELGRFFERILAGQTRWPTIPELPLTELAAEVVPADWVGVGPVIESARTIGNRLAQLHRSLVNPDDPAFSPESFSLLDQRSLYQSMRNRAGRVLRHLKTVESRLEGGAGPVAREILKRQQGLYARLEPLLQTRLSGSRIRVHGDLSLKKMLFTGRDYVFIDFDGDPNRALADRRRKWSPMRDVATLVQSFEEIATAGLHDPGLVRETDRAALKPWARLWAQATSATLLRHYVVDMDDTGYLGRTTGEKALLLEILRLDAVLEEISLALARGQPQPIETALDALVRLLPAVP